MEKPNFQIYTDDEMRLVEGRETMSDALQRRLVQSTIANMISTTQQLTKQRYPTFAELYEVANHLCKIYPALDEV